MTNDNKTPVVIRTQVYLNDPDYFCNKSWTMSFNLNTKSWISYHSYIPNFYIAENNFFYSGLNGCCEDISAGGFQAIAGVLDKIAPTTTSTTTIYPSPTTTTTTTVLNCTLTGMAVIINCELEGNAVITVPPTTTTTICQRPSNLHSNVFGSSYQIENEPVIDSFNNLSDACNAVSLLRLRSINVKAIGFTVQATSYEVGQVVYNNSNSTDCLFAKTGWFFTDEGVSNNFVYNIEDGVIKEIVYCNCDSTTSTTTTAPFIDNCCTALISSGTNIYYHNLRQPMEIVNVPDYAAGIGIAMTKNYLWSVDTEFHQWDITLLPFNATFNKNIVFPISFTTSSGITALNDETLITTNSFNSPQVITEINITDITSTPIFNLQTNRVAIGNLILTSNNKLLLINQNNINNNYYLTQYDYPLGTIEYDIQITTITPTNLYECDCSLFIVDDLGTSWVLDKVNPYTLLPAETFTYTPISITQVSSCFSAEIPLTTTTTTTF